MAMYFRFGRRKTALSYSVLRMVGVLLSSLSASYAPFVVGRFLIGFAGSGSFLASFILGNNVSASLQWRHHALMDLFYHFYLYYHFSTFVTAL